jgi:hypothetical protein
VQPPQSERFDVFDVSITPNSAGALAERPASSSETSAFPLYWKRCRDAGLRFIVTAPADTATFARGLRFFPERVIDAGEHARWWAAYRRFRAEQYRARGVALGERDEFPHDAGSWCILAVTGADEVVGALSARIFCGEVVEDYLYDPILVADCPEPLRAEYLAAIATVRDECRRRGAMLGELSNWSVAEAWRTSAVSPGLLHAITAFSRNFQPHCGVTLANCESGARAMLRKMGGVPFHDRTGRELPPFFHPRYQAHLELLRMNAADYAPKFRPSAEEIAQFRRESRIVSAA